MKITQWFGYNEESSQYLLRRGELRALVNLQPRRPGMLISRDGMAKLFGTYNEEPIYGLYRKDTPFGEPDIFFIFQKVQVERQLTEAQQLAGETPLEYVWMVSRLSGTPLQSRVINEQPLSPNGLTQISNMSVAEDRHGRLFIFYGHGAKPIMYRPTLITNIGVEMGLSAPTAAPSITAHGEGYFIERIDVTAGGGSFWGPPAITIDGGSPARTGRAKAIVESGSIVGIEVIDGGADYKTAPNVIIADDKIGSGFRGVGVLETDPGVQGFVETATPTVSAYGALTATETYGTIDGLDGNKILYVDSPLVAMTTYTAPAGTSQTTMVVGNAANVDRGDFVTISPRATGFNSDADPPVRVTAVDRATNTVTLNRSFTPTNGVTYTVQFRRNTTIQSIDATFDPNTNTFTASMPLRTTLGTGSGASATLRFAAKSNGFRLGPFTETGYTVPSGGPTPTLYAFSRTGWEVYNLKGPDYWNGHPTAGANAAGNNEYAGLQASGSTVVYGYSGSTRVSQRYRRTTERRADVYWPDYSKISVWLNTGLLSTSATQWTRQDCPVYGLGTDQPYILVTLKPSLKQRTTVNRRGGRSTATDVPYVRQGNFRYPVIRINLRNCPDSWVINESDGMNYPTNVKEASSARIAWWNAAATTPRPLTDFRGAQAGVALDYGTVEVVDPGQGWEKNTLFACRIHQANPYEQTSDFNVSTREIRRAGSHSRYAASNRFTTFLFRATEQDTSVAGPPAVISGPANIDVGGQGYRTGDIAALTLVKRSLGSAIKTPVARFAGYFSVAGNSTEFTASNGAQIVRVSGNSITTAIRERATIECVTPSILFDFSEVMAVNTGSNTLTLDKMARPGNGVSQSFTGTAMPGSNTITGISSTQPFFIVGRKFREMTSLMSAPELTVTAVTDDGTTKTVTFSAPAADGGSATFRPIYDFVVYSGAREAQTLKWTASQISPAGTTQRVGSVRILSGGRNYYSPPAIYARGGGTGYGLSVKAEVSGGRVTAVTVLDPGRDYTAPPELYTDSTTGDASAVMRPSLRGTYRCAYRFADRSETVIGSTAIVGMAEEATSITVDDSSAIKAGMILEADWLPFMTRVSSVVPSGVAQQARIVLSQPASVRGFLNSIVIQDAGSGYANGEVVTATIDGLPAFAATVSLGVDSDGNRFVNSATVTNNGGSTFPAGRVTVRFSAPAAGGEAATGYAFAGLPDPSSSYSKSITIRDLTKPISYSDFSPIADVDVGPNDQRQHASELRWNLSGVTPPARADMVEFYRTSADQSLVFYRLEMYGVPSANGVEIVGSDTMTDEELFDPDRANYAAVPVVLPNGNVNAYRFGKPRTDMSVCVAFQDRLWYGVSTSGKDNNTLFYSEFDEFESCPDINELPIQNNQRSTDSLTALVPFGSMLLAMQHSHTYAVTYNTDPGIDASIQMISHRGCLNQRCWDIHDNLLYAADENGIYVMARTGEVQALSNPIREFFNSELLDFASRDTFFLTVCNRTRILRFFCSMASQTAPTPTMALCYHIDQKSWWVERFPNSMSSAITGRPRASRINCSVYGAADGNIYEFKGEADSLHRSLVSVLIENHGDGYTSAPTITCPRGYGVQLQGVVNEGRLVDVLIHSNGWDVRHGYVLQAESGLDILAEDGSLLTGAEHAPIPLTISAPNPGGTQAVAYGVFGNITKLNRRVSVTQGTNYVTLIKNAFAAIDLSESAFLTNEAPLYSPEAPVIIDGGTATPQPTELIDGGDASAAPGLLLDGGTAGVLRSAILASQNGRWIRSEITPIEVGMEAFSECLPLGAVVKSILGSNVYLENEDGTPLTTIGTNSNVQVVFIKKYKSHVPFRLATGHLQLINETNVQKGGDGQVDRSVSLLYSPTKTDKYIELVEYYNASTTPRPNTMRRNRGGPGGFAHRQDSASTVLNLGDDASALGAATGVAKATFASATHADLTGPDRHIRIELHGRIAPANVAADLTPHQFVLHTMTVDGVIEDAE